MQTSVRTRLLARAVGFTLAAVALATPVLGQGFYPYYGKNKVRYDRFDWRIYRSAHFEVYFYPEFEQHLGRVTSYLESSYRVLSSGLKHEMKDPIPVILYKTHSEFEQTSLFPTFMPEGVLAFAEPTRGRMILPIDEAPDRLQGLITHELTHVFAFDMIPRGVFQRDIPLWIDEGLAEYFRGVWDPLDVAMVRDAAVTDRVPRLSRAEFQPLSGRLVYNIGHAAFEFMEARFGKEGVRQFLYTLRKGTLGGKPDDLYKQAFRITAADFDTSFEKWLKERFKPYRDKERPSDYGRDLSPDDERTPYTQVYGFSPSPSGELVVALTANRSEGEADIVLLSTLDGAVVKNLTKGFTQAYESISFANSFTQGRSIGFDPNGSSVAFFARREKLRTLFLLSVTTGDVTKRYTVDVDQAQGPCFHPDGRQILFSGLRGGVSDIFSLDRETGEIRNLTNDPQADSDPQVSPDGTLVVYTRRISGNEKVYVMRLDDPSRKTQLTFGAHNDTAPSFSTDGKRIYYSSNEDDEIFNLRSLDLETGVVRQLTDALGGNMAPAVLAGKGPERVAFITYSKGEFRLFSKDVGEALKEVEQEVSATPEDFVDFQADISHDVVPENKERKPVFKGLELEGRPALNVGVTSNGDFFGGSAVALTDVLGDHSFVFSAYSVREFRSYSLAYQNLSRRFQYGFSAFDFTQFYYVYAYGYYYQNYFSREGAVATQRVTGARLLGQYPLTKFTRIEGSVGAYRIEEGFGNQEVLGIVQETAETGGYDYSLNNGYLAPVSARLVNETTRFEAFGPVSGKTIALGLEYAPSVGRLLGRQTVELDARKYLRLGATSTLLAFRFRGFHSTGTNPAINYFGGNNEMRGFPYYGFQGNTGFHANAEMRVPIIKVALTPIGVIGEVRGTAFFNLGGTKWKGQDWTPWTSEPGYSYTADPVFGTAVSGLRLVDSHASWGFGVMVPFLGYPLHFDWAKLTDLKTSTDWTFSFWLGFDF